MSLNFAERNPERNPMFLHPVLLAAVEQIIAQTEQSLGAGFTVKMISTLRTPERQREIWRQGRETPGPIVTHVDGFNKLSNHNYQPSQAVDFGIFKGGKYLTQAEFYNHLGAPTRAAGLTWGGDWNSFKDRPHIEIPRSLLLDRNRKKGSAIVWQTYLRMAGTYQGEMDGLFGPMSRRALKAAVGSDRINRDTYRILFERFGALSPADLLPGSMNLAA